VALNSDEADSSHRPDSMHRDGFGMTAWACEPVPNDAGRAMAGLRDASGDAGGALLSRVVFSVVVL
jgi:hypothetical protein